MNHTGGVKRVAPDSYDACLDIPRAGRLPSKSKSGELDELVSYVLFFGVQFTQLLAIAAGQRCAHSQSSMKQIAARDFAATTAREQKL